MENNIISKAQATQVSKKPTTLQDYLKQMEGEIAKALPSVITPERFTRMVLSAISSTPKLKECTPASFLGAMMTAAQLGVEPNTALGQAYLIPFENRKKGVVECQFQLGYKGLIDLAYRSEQISVIQAQTVYANDTFEFEYGLEPKLKHIPAKSDRGEAIYYYATFRTKDGGFGFEVMSVADVRNHAQKYSQAFNKSSSPWTSNFDEMAKKTVLKRVLKYAPLKSDFARGLAQDSSIKTEISSDMYSVNDVTNYNDYEDKTDVNVVKNTGEIIENETTEA